MIIISDTSPLSALAEIGELNLLQHLYGRVVIPEAVRRECSHPHSPPGVSAAIEAAGISLAWLHRDTATLIIDERDGRSLCEALGLRKTGTAGVLLEAAMSGFVDFDAVMAKLQATSFRLSPAVVATLRARWLVRAP